MKRTIAAAAAVAFVTKILIATMTFGTNDVYRYEIWGIWGHYLGVGAYDVLTDISQMPSMLHLLYGMSWLGSVTPLPFGFWLRVPGILADAGSVWLLCRILGARLHEATIGLAVLLFALSPAAVMISGYHGNTDPIIVFLILLAIDLSQSGRPAWIVGIVLGAATCVKAVPLILIPAFLFYMAGLRRRIQFLLGMGGILVACSAPYLFQNPGLVLRHVLGYRSLAGRWGISWILIQIGNRIPAVARFEGGLLRLENLALFALVALISFLMNRLPERRDLFRQCSAAMMVFLTLSPGFGVQYLTWIFPWVVVLGAPAAALVYATSSVFLFAVYNYWSQGLPWYLADSWRPGSWIGSLDPLQILCWLSIATCTWIFFRSPGKPRIRWLHTIVTAQAACTFYILTAPYFFRGPQSTARGVNEVRASAYVELSDILLRKARYPDVISAATSALRLNWDLPAAYNNIATAENAMGAWDEAIRNSREALRLSPDSLPASRNLAYALEQKDLTRGAREAPN